MQKEIVLQEFALSGTLIYVCIITSQNLLEEMYAVNGMNITFWDQEALKARLIKESVIFVLLLRSCLLRSQGWNK